MKRAVAVTLLVLALCGLHAPARSQPGFYLSGSVDGNAVITQDPTTHLFQQTVTVDGLDVLFGPFTGGSTAHLDFSDPANLLISDGHFTLTFTSGILFGISSGNIVIPNPGSGLGLANLHYLFTGGTGQFEGFTGNATITGTLTRTGPTTADFIGAYAGFISAVPEPGLLALLLGSGVAGVFHARRLRKTPRR